MRLCHGIARENMEAWTTPLASFIMNNQGLVNHNRPLLVVFENSDVLLYYDGGAFVRRALPML